MIPGLFIETDWITREREHELVSAIGERPREWGAAGHRMVQRYGTGVMASGYRTGMRGTAIPAHLDAIRVELAPLLDANAITVAWYQPGDGLAAHIDKSECGEVIAIVSLLGDATMTMLRNGRQSLEFSVPRRSLTILRGEARHLWLHEIAPVPSHRIAIVLRQATL